MAVGIIVNTNLSQVFQDNISTPVLVVVGINGAVFSSSKAIIVEVILFTECAFPEHIMRRHQHLLSKLEVLHHEIGNEVECTII